jgi:MFS family permease
MWLGTIGFAGQIPVLLLAPIAGPLLDRCSLRKVLIATQILSMLQAFALAYLVTHHISIAQIATLSIIRGCISAFDIPAKQALLTGLADDFSDRAGMLAFDSVVVNLCRMLGPALGGLLLASSGERACFLVDGISYTASLAALLMMRSRTKYWKREFRWPGSLFEGWAWIQGLTEGRSAFLLLCITSLVALPFTVLLPLHVRDVLHAGPGTLGNLGCVSSVAAIIASCVIASCQSSLLAMLRRLGLFGAGIALVGLALSRDLRATLGAVFVVSFSIMIQIAATNVYVQSSVPEQLRGRISTFYSAAFWGMVPIGSLLLGAIAHPFGCRAAFGSEGLCCLLAVFLCFIHVQIHRPAHCGDHSISSSVIRSLLANRKHEVVKLMLAQSFEQVRQNCQTEGDCRMECDCSRLQGGGTP